MSLINDALKRTKEVQQQSPPAAGGPALRPVEPDPPNAGGGARTLLFIMVAAVILGNFLLWMAFKDRTAVPVAAKGPASSPAPSQLADPPPTATSQFSNEPAVAMSASSPTPMVATPIVSAAASTPATMEPQPETVATNAPEPEPKVVFTEPPRPTVLRLQSIIYGTRPSAMIGGKFLFLGDSIQGHQLIAIDKETVTLVGGGETNVLSLP
jgi:hypothetical protein